MAEPTIAQKAPFATELEARQDLLLVRLRKSKNQPFCDGSHKDTGLTPLAFTADKTGARISAAARPARTRPIATARTRACDAGVRPAGRPRAARRHP